MLVPQLLMSSLLHLLPHLFCVLFIIAILILTFRIIFKYSKQNNPVRFYQMRAHSKQDISKSKISMKSLSNVLKQSHKSDAIILQTNCTNKTRVSLQIPFVTWIRGGILVLTAIAILVVDFPHFPSRLGKCSPSGISLMDCGAGCIVFITSLTCAAARSKQTQDLFNTSLKRYPYLRVQIRKI